MAQPSQRESETGISDLRPFEFFSLFLQFNRRLIALLNHFDSPLSTAESHFLAELDHNQTLISKDLSDKLFSDKSTVSRTLSSLKKKGLIKNTQCKTDKRTKISTTTSKGLLLLQKDIEVRNKEVLSCSYPLNEEQRTDLTSILNELSDLLHAAVAPNMPNMEPLLVAIRRLGKVMGIIGGSVFETGFSSQYLQVIWLAYQSGGQISLKDLSFSLSYPASEVSQILNKLQSDSLILRQTLEDDKRFISVTLTPKGLKLAEQVIKISHNYFEDLVKNISQQKVDKLYDLLVKCLVCPLPSELIPGKDKYLVKKLSSEQELTNARAFLTEKYVYEGLHRFIGSIILDTGNNSFIVLENSKIIGVCEYKIEKQKIEFLNFCYPQNIPSRVFFCDIAWFVLKELTESTEVVLSPVVAQQLHLQANLKITNFLAAITR
jgi:DNA-binding MarR family transcriptional regulator